MRGEKMKRYAINSQGNLSEWKDGRIVLYSEAKHLEERVEELGREKTDAYLAWGEEKNALKSQLQTANERVTELDDVLDKCINWMSDRLEWYEDMPNFITNDCRKIRELFSKNKKK